MNNRLLLSNRAPGTNQSGKAHTTHLDSFQRDTLTLSKEQLLRIARLQHVFREARPMTLEGWTEGIILDKYPEQEISILESVAVAYQKVTLNGRFILEEKKSLYNLICAISCGAAEPSDMKKSVSNQVPFASKIYEMYFRH